MSSAVYFASVRARGDAESKMMKVRRLFDAAGFADCVAPHDFVALKIHFGERGATPISIPSSPGRSWTRSAPSAESRS